MVPYTLRTDNRLNVINHFEHCSYSLVYKLADKLNDIFVYCLLFLCIIYSESVAHYYYLCVLGKAELQRMKQSKLQKKVWDQRFPSDHGTEISLDVRSEDCPVSSI